MNELRQRVLPIVLATLALVALGWIVASAEVSTHSIPIPRFAPPEEPEQSSSTESRSPPMPGEGAPATPPEPPAWFGWIEPVFWTLLAAAALAVIGWLLFRFFSTPPKANTRIDDTVATRAAVSEMRGAVRAGLSDIDSGGDPRAAVIGCWLRLERAAAAAGVARLESETPSDLVARLLAAARVDDAALRRLTDAYHRARYAPDTVDTELRDSARAALTAIDERLSQPQGAP